MVKFGNHNIVEDMSERLLTTWESVEEFLQLRGDWHEKSKVKLVIVAVGGVIGTLWTYRAVQSYYMRSKLRKKIKERENEREKGFEMIEAKWEHSKAADLKRRDQILSLSFEDLKEGLSKNKYTAREVVNAYQWKAVQVQKSTNCLTEVVIEAEQWAKDLDESSEKLSFKGPLFGIPFSVKESISMKGYDATRGYAQDLGHPSEKDAVIVQDVADIASAGSSANCSNKRPTILAFLYLLKPGVRHVNQSIQSITVRISHKFANIDKTPGGSSGGEAALLALGGAVFGIGGDVGGSIRMPAHFCGIAGIKPSHLRISNEGSAGSVPGRQMVSASVGPMAQRVDTLAAIMKHLTTSLTYGRDPYVAPVPFRNILYSGNLGGGSKKVLTIGYYENDGFFPATPAVQRALNIAKEKLEANGHKLVPWQPPNIGLGLQYFTACVTADGGRYLADRLNHDIVHSNVRTSAVLFSMSPYLRRMLGYLMARIGDPFTANNIINIPLNTTELRKVFVGVKEYRQEFLESWKSSGLDCILCPPQASPAMPHSLPTKTLPTVSYTALYNLMDFAAGVVPVTFVNDRDIESTKTDYPQSTFITRMVRKANLEESLGLPVGVQCVALPFEEEVCLRLMREVETAVDFKSPL